MVFISRSLTYEDLNSGGSSSSNKFESGVINEINKVRSVAVINISKKNEGEVGDDYFHFSNYMSFLFYWVKNHGVKSTVFVSTGYHLNLIATLLILKALGGSSFSYIYDTHKSSIITGKFKKLFFNFYYGLGFYFARFIDGWLVINNKFYSQWNNKIDCLLTKVGVDNVYPNIATQKKTNLDCRKTIIMVGTLNHENGFGHILELFREDTYDFDLIVIGYGDLENEISELSRNHGNIRFFRRMENSQVIDQVKNAYCCLHLRDPDSVSCSFAFPSKLIEYLNYGNRVASNDFPGLNDDYRDCLELLDDFSTNALQSYFDNLKIERDICFEKRIKLVSSHKWEVLVNEILIFVESK